MYKLCFDFFSSLLLQALHMIAKILKSICWKFNKNVWSFEFATTFLFSSIFYFIIAIIFSSLKPYPISVYWWRVFISFIRFMIVKWLLVSAFTLWVLLLHSTLQPCIQVTPQFIMYFPTIYLRSFWFPSFPSFLNM